MKKAQRARKKNMGIGVSPWVRLRSLQRKLKGCQVALQNRRKGIDKPRVSSWMDVMKPITSQGEPMLDALSRAMRPRKPNPLEAWKAPKLPGDRQGQVHFYIYDRGQCFDKGEEAILAMVNLNGCAAHYMTKRSNQAWTFVALPHLSTEKRCCERMGYRNLAHMHEHLFRL